MRRQVLHHCRGPRGAILRSDNCKYFLGTRFKDGVLMTAIQLAQLTSAVLGVIGTALLFFNSYALQPREGTVFGSSTVTAHNDRVKAENAWRLIWQRTGFGFLCGSFAIQIVAVFL
jgi:hypothetical protein